MVVLLYLIPIWIITLLAMIPLYLLGWILIPLAVLCGAYSIQISPHYKREVTLFNWKIMAPYQNYEDGIDAGLEFPNAPKWFRIIVWSAYRNPIEGIRWLPYISYKIRPENIKFIMKSENYNVTEKDATGLTKWFLDDLEEGRYDKHFYYLTWDGLYGNFRVEFPLFGKTWRFWIGNKIYPSHVKGVDFNDYQRYGTDFAKQIKRVK